MLFLVSVLGQSWATLLLNGPPGAIGRGLTLAGLVLAGIAAAKWFSSTPVTDGSAHTKAKEPEKSSKSYKPGLQS
jgi:hypothetical protein